MKKRNTQDAQEATRLRVVAYLKKEMGTQKEAGNVFGITERGVNKIWCKYKEGGKKALLSKKRGVREGKKIKSEQAKEIKRLIRDKMPEQLKLSYGLWTRDGVKDLIKKKYEICLSKWQVGRYLKKWGYTPQKPIAKAIEQKEEKVREWLEKEYPKIKKKAKKENAVIYWGDETGMRSDHQAGKSYSPKGKTPVIKKTGQRFSINMISAMSNRGHLQFMIMEAGFNSEVFMEFMERMIKQKNQKIFFIVDGHPSHKTIIVNTWLEEHKKKIKIFFLPPYSPELNPDEYLNQDIKTNVIGKKRAINKKQMKGNVTKFMYRRKNNFKQVQKYFHEKHVKYAA